MPLGTAITTRGRTMRRRLCTLLMKWRSIASVTSKSAMTPSFKRTDGYDVARSAAQHALGLITNSEHLFGALLHGYHRRFAQDDAVILDVNKGIGRAEIDTDVV